MAAKVKLEEGTSFIRGRSSKKAKELVERLGDGEGQIITTAFGYIVPSSIVQDSDNADSEYANRLPDGTDVAKAERGESEEKSEEESEEPAKAERKSARTRKATDAEEGK